MNSPIPCQLKKLTTRADRSIDITFSTQELHAEDMASLFDLRDSLGYLYFHNQPFTEVDTNNLRPIENNAKSKSQRLRNVWFKAWEEHGKESGTRMSLNL